MNSDEPHPASGQSAQTGEAAALMEAVTAADMASSPETGPGKASIQPYDFKTPILLAPHELRKLRIREDEFAAALGARLSIYLRRECSFKLAAVQTIPYSRLVKSWTNPSHLSLFKIEPLRGVSILEVPPKLCLSIVDSLMGGPGQAQEADRQMTEIELALMDQTVQMMLGEWCSGWAKTRELKPVLLGFETNGQFVQTASPETMMLVIGFEAAFGEASGLIQMGLPHASMEPLIQQLAKSPATARENVPAAVPKPAPVWNPILNDVSITMTAEWETQEMSAREILSLKPGEVLKISPNSQQIQLRLADSHKFNGRVGTVGGQWAVEVTGLIK